MSHQLKLVCVDLRMCMVGSGNFCWHMRGHGRSNSSLERCPLGVNVFIQCWCVLPHKTLSICRHMAIWLMWNVKKDNVMVALWYNGWERLTPYFESWVTSEYQVQCVFLSGGEIYQLFKSKFLGHIWVSLANPMWAELVCNCAFLPVYIWEVKISTDELENHLMLLLNR